MNTFQLQSVFVDLEFADGGYSLVSYTINPDPDDNTQFNIQKLMDNLSFQSESDMLNSVRNSLKNLVHAEFGCKWFSFSTVHADLSGQLQASEIVG
jgi:hypothetical protein